MIEFAILTISDGVASGKRVDLSGDAIEQLLSSQKYRLNARAVVADEHDLIVEQLQNWCATDDIRLILTTGGTGLAPRDVTPQATKSVADYEIAGISEFMRITTTTKTPTAILSRAIAVVSSKTLIINLPGSPKGVHEMLTCISDIIPHAIDMIDGGGHPTNQTESKSAHPHN